MVPGYPTLMGELWSIQKVSSHIYIPTIDAEQWKQFLAEPEKQWRQGFSARSLAYCWQQADGFPPEIRAVLSVSSSLANAELLFAVPEHQVPLPGGSRPSQNDLWALARSGNQLVSIAVEGKVSEPFGPSMQEWLANASRGKIERLDYLCDLLGLTIPLPNGIRYQLLHRAASAVIEAKRFTAAHAVMLVHSFSQSDAWFEDYAAFVALFGSTAKINTLVPVGACNGISMNFAWVRGDKQFLSK